MTFLSSFTHPRVFQNPVKTFLFFLHRTQMGVLLQQNIHAASILAKVFVFQSVPQAIISNDLNID